jgi:hypothetical protein
MSSRQRKTLEAVFASPVPKGLRWGSIESLLRSVGCEAVERGGSRVSFKYRALKGGAWIEHRVDFHRPHPGKEALPYQVEDVRRFLAQIGVLP